MSEKQTSFIAAFFASVFTLLIYFLNEPATIPGAKTSTEEKMESYQLPWIDPNHLLDSIRSMDTAYYFTDQVKLLKGHLFSPDDIHIFLRYDQHENKQYDRHREVYQSIKGETRMLWSDIFEDMIYGFPDTIADINGDGYGDFLQFYWPMSGCCTRMCLHTHLYNPKISGFEPELDFINAVFYPDEKIVLNKEYGSPGTFQKMRWNGFQLDTLERIEYAETREKIFRVDCSSKKEKITVIQSEPTYYRFFDELDTYYTTDFIWPIESQLPEEVPDTEPIANY